LLVIYSVIFLFIQFTQQDRSSSEIIPQNKVLSNAEQTEKIAQILGERDSITGKYDALFYRGINCIFLGYACGDGITDSPSGIFGSGMKLLAFPFANPVASGVEYVKDSLASVGLAPKAEAAEGLGFASLSGYINIWKAFRNLSFLVFTIIIIAIGFMIMFRFNAGQAEIKIETALPRIVIAMILITFSFALAGFFVDLMYASIALSIGIFKGAGFQNLTSSWTGYNNSNFLHFAESGFIDILPFGGRLLGSSFIVGNDLWNMLPGVISSILSPVISLFAIGATSQALFPGEKFIDSFKNLILLGNGIGGAAGLLYVPAFISFFILIVNYLPGIILGIIIGLTLLIFMVRMLFVFLSAYVKVLLFTIFSPVILLFSAIPGNGSASWWIKTLLAELSVFPTFVVITMTSAAILEVNKGFNWGSVDEWIWHAQSTKGAFNLPFIAAGFRPESFNNIVSLGILLMAPDFIKMIKSMFGVEEKLNFSPGLFFGSLGVMTGLLGSANSLGTSIMGQQGFEDLRKHVMDNTKTKITTIGSGIKDKVKKLHDKRTGTTTPPSGSIATTS
jgi:hypothetical protein